MRITVAGTGYVGLVAGACLAELGNEVTCLDIDQEKIAKLQGGIIPIYESGLPELVKRNIREQRLLFSTETQQAIQNAEVIFIAVGTPSLEHGGVNMQYMDGVAKSIGEHMNKYTVIVNKSTVPVGTVDRVTRIVRESQKQDVDFDVVSNPEFLRQGQAVYDFMHPDRVVVGTHSEKAREVMAKIYRSLERPDKPIIFTDPRSSELIKYASNAMLATRISFVNELARLCEKVGGDVKMVAKGMGLDDRIGPRFLQAGAGYGGSCFPKDVKGVIDIGKQQGVPMTILQAVHDVNEEQKKILVPKLQRLVPDLHGKKIAVWGLAFKPKTDDLREAPSLVIIEELQKLGARIVAFDPEAQHNAQRLVQNVEFAEKPLDALQGCHALIIVTEWNEFRYLDKEKMRELLIEPNIVDGRNIYDPEEMRRLGFNYVCVGR
jgi:UDPglucose 6-dehydrogenase